MRNVKIIISTFILTAAMSVVGFAQNTEEMKSIGHTVDLINQNLATYDKKTKTVDGVSTEGTDATYYLSGRGLQKISAHVYGETFNGTISVYFQGEEPVFAYFKYNGYQMPIGKTVKIAQSETKRFYFAGDQVLMFSIDDKEVKSSDSAYSENVESIKQMIVNLKAGYGATGYGV
jgi:hypothetical protein